MRRKIVAGNWKMIPDRESAFKLFHDIGNGWWGLQPDENVEVWIAPPANYEWAALEFFLSSGAPPVKVISQNCSKFHGGAHTGEISASSLKSDGIYGIIVGHSERRNEQGEDDHTVAEKVSRVLEQDMVAILCVGESADQRNNKQENSVVESQVRIALEKHSASEIGKVVIAYEPVWAIGSNNPATPDQAQSMHAFIRSVVEKMYNKTVSDNIRILYGGSCKASNAEALFKQTDIDGGLIGGASLNAREFLTIAKSFPPGR